MAAKMKTIISTIISSIRLARLKGHRSPDNDLINRVYFSESYYRRNNPDVVEASIDPLAHYLASGWREGRKPSAYFCPTWYIKRYPDVLLQNIEPLSHFANYGIFEKRQPHPLIDIEYYLEHAPDVKDAGVNPYAHYIISGDAEGRSAHPLFNPQYYRAIGDNIAPFNAFEHYVEFGVKAQRSPSPAFDPSHYLLHYPEDGDDPIRNMLLNPLSRRHFHPLIDGFYQKQTSLSAHEGLHPLVDYIQNRSNIRTLDWKKQPPLSAEALSLPPRREIKNIDNLPGNKSPKVSIITPCFNSNRSYLDACVTSILSQSYINWELILIDDGSSGDDTWDAIKFQSSRDNRIISKRLEINGGISAATNVGVQLSSGSVLAFVDHDDTIAPHAIQILIEEMISTGSDAVYSDQAFMSSNGFIEECSYKPDWSHILFLGAMYVGHLLLVRKYIAEEAGLFKSEFDGCQDYEFMLRVSEKTKRISHVRDVLYFWRRSPNSTAANSDAKGKIEPLQTAAIDLHLSRLKINARAIPHSTIPHRVKLIPDTKLSPRDLDIICFNADKTNLDSIHLLFKKSYVNIKSINVTNSDMLPYKAWNAGRADYVLFLDATLNFELGSSIDRLFMYNEMPNVAFSAPHRYRIDGLVSNAGYIVEMDASLAAAYAGYEGGADGSVGSLVSDREVAALDGSFTLAKRAHVDSTGGLLAHYNSLDGAVLDASFRSHLRGYHNISISEKIVIGAREAPFPSSATYVDCELFRELYARNMYICDPFESRGIHRASVNGRF